MKPCRHGHPLSDRYRRPNGKLRCRECDQARTLKRRVANSPALGLILSRPTTAFRIRQQLWEAWQALGELRETRGEIETPLPAWASAQWAVPETRRSSPVSVL